MSGSPIDGVLTGLVAVYASAAPTGVTVYDGEPDGTPPRQFLCVGHDESDDAAVQVVVSHADGAARRFTQALDVSCLLSCWEGKGSGPSLRTEIAALYGTFDAALATNRRLNGAAMLADVTAYEYQANRVEGVGLLAQIRFTVHVQAIK